MGKFAAKKTDKIVSPGDVHIILVPSPGGPVPTPTPHPVTSSIIKGKVAEKVKVMGLPGAVKGSISQHTPPHVPIGGPFQKKPKNEGEIITASSNVFYEGKAAAMVGDTANMCADPSDAPVGTVVVQSATVEIGGGGSGSGGDGSVDGKGQDASGAKGAASVAPPLNQATTEGHPVDVVTGSLIAQGEDFTLEGPIPLQFVRTYSSADALTDGALGHGWSHNLQQRVDLVDRFHADWDVTHEQFVADGVAGQCYVVYRDANGIPTTYVAPEIGGEIRDQFRRRVIRRESEAFTVADDYGIVQRFAERRRWSGIFLPAESIDRNGNRLQFRYDDSGRPNEIEDAYGRTLILAYDQGRITELRVRVPGEAERQWCSYGYDEAGDLVEMIDRSGFKVRYAYADHLIVEERDRDDYAFYFTYDSRRRCVSTWGQDGYFARHLDYDTAKRRTRVVNGEGETTIYSYNALGVVTRTERGLDFYQETRYDDQGRVIARASGQSTAATFAYDKTGRVQSVADGELNEQRFEYNDLGQVTQMIDASGAVQRYTYDARGNLLTRTAATGAITRYEYDDRGRVVRQRFPGGGERAFSYDAFGHVTRVVEGDDIRTYEYDAYGQLTRRVMANGTVYAYEWNAQGYPARETTNGRVTAVLEYTREGNVSSALDAAGILRTYEFGPPGVPIKIVEYASSTKGKKRERSRVTIDVDTEGRPRTATNQLGQRYRFVYDDAGRIAEQVTPDGTTQWFTYDRAGFVASIRTSHGDRQRFEYNGRGLPTKVVYADGSEETFDYDPMGRTIAATNKSVRLEWEYDAAGQVSVRRQGDFELRSEVDEAQNQVAWVSSDDFRVGILPSTKGALAAIDFGGRLISVASDRAPNRVTRIMLPNGIGERHEHDSWGRRTKDEVRTLDRLLVRRHVEYDADGHVQSIDDSMRGGLRKCFYDDLDRLVGVQGARTERYAFDDASNIVSSHRFAPARIESPDQLRHLNQRTYDYDAMGRVTGIGDGDRSWLLHYNVKGEVASVDLPDGGAVHYTYDPLGRRIEKRFDGGIRDGRHVRFVWQGGDVFKEQFVSGEDVTGERFYLFSPDGPRARIDREPDGSETALYYHNDHVGTPHFCTDDEGNVVWTSEVDSYGYQAVAPGDDDDFQNIRLPGQYFDEETGLHYNRFRYYDPVSARYLQPDPIDTLVNPNRFSYPLDPLGGTDPLGLQLLVLNADPGDHTNSDRDLFTSAGWATQTKKYSHVDGYLSPNGDIGQVGKLLDPNLGDLRNYDHIVIHAHGNPSSIAVGKPGLWTKIRRKLPGGRYYSGAMSGGELAKLLRERNFKGKVTIVACSTAGDNGNKPNFAQELADGLGAGSQVVAWDEAVIVDPETGRAAATWNMSKAVPSIDPKMHPDLRDFTWGTMPESFGRWTFEAGKPPVPG